jgi:hypothetical protein
MPTNKKNDLAARVANIPRGPGFRLSTDVAPEAPVNSPPTEPVAEPQVSSSAETPEHTSAEPQNRKKAVQPIRVNRGVSVREDLIIECKRLALDDRRKLYEILDEALTEYLQRRGRLPGGVGER